MFFFYLVFSMASITNAQELSKINKQMISQNVHQFGINPLAFTGLELKEPWGEGDLQKSMFFYRFLNKSNLNPYFNLGGKISRQQSSPDPLNGTIDENKTTNYQIQFGVDHRFFVTPKLGIYAGIGFIYLKRDYASITKFNTGSNIQETAMHNITERNGAGISTCIEYSINSRFKIATRVEYRKLLETQKVSFQNTAYPDLTTSTATNRIFETVMWPCQLILQYNLSTI